MTPQQIEAMKLALEALKQIDEAMPFPVAKLAQKAIREALAQPERHELQAKGEHPAPCARHCEANAFQIVIKNLKAQLAQPEQEPVAWINWCAATGKRTVSFECESELASQPLYEGITQNTQYHYSKFHSWFDSELHRQKYTKDHPAYLAAQEAWNAANDAAQHRINRLNAEIEAWKVRFKIAEDALAKLNGTEQKPVAWMDADGNVSDNNDHKCFPIPLYTHPPQRTWVDVPDEEIKILWIQYRAALPRYLCFAKALVSRSKEKNT